MHIVVDTQPDPARYGAAFRYVLRPVFLRVRILGAIFFVLSVVFIVALGPDGWPVSLFLCLIGLLYAAYVPWRSVQASIRRLPPVTLQPARWELTDQGVSMASPLMSAQYAWGAFVKSVEYHGMLLLLTSPRQVVPVPLAGVPAEQLAELRAVLANRTFARQ